MNRRKYLKKGILLFSESGEKKQFEILKKISGEGASAVCYEACYGRSGKGVLKEFYPIDGFALARDEEGQLIPSESNSNDFIKARNEYVKPYRMMLDAKRSNDEGDLATFIPAFEIYFGSGENSTAYIWSPEPELETFDKICGEIHKHPAVNPEHKLVTVLTAVENLTKCICALHCADMIHRDIKPSNFGFLKRGAETLTQTISMFDINSVCSVYGEETGLMGTAGYTEPMEGQTHADNRTDIYSIGATLFNAVIITEETAENDYLYKDIYYEKIRELVDSSKLIKASEANYHPRLRNALTRILEKCLDKRNNRYECCEELLEDIETALYYALPSEIANKVRSGEKWVLTDVEKSLDKNKDKNSTLALQYHLYETPLYKCVGNDESIMNILLIGFGNYGQKFLDVCLQAGQMRGKNLNVTVISDDDLDKEIYLSERPQLDEFFDVDASLNGSYDIYGKISFRLEKLDRKNSGNNADIFRSMITGENSPHYVFIALGDDRLNYITAEACGTFKKNCVVSYVSEGKLLQNKKSTRLYPVKINNDVKKLPLYNEIERIAFNIHLIWEKSFNVDHRRVRRNFREAYNHDACVANALSLKYKLFGIPVRDGCIDLDRFSYDCVAQLFAENVLSGNQTVRNELIAVEHRRWVTEKLCLGWKGMSDLKECMNGVTGDKKHKRHVCILRSRADNMLEDGFACKESWDNASDEELDRLDELDRMSVELHREFVKKAKLIRNRNILDGNNIGEIRAAVRGDRSAASSFREWFACLKDIWGGDMTKVRLYKGLKNAFLEATENLSSDNRKNVKEQVRAFEDIFFPVLAAAEYRNWKDDDVKLTDNIPFLLTYTEDSCMVIPYTDHESKVVENIASATLVNPSRIIYLYHAKDKYGVKRFTDTLAGVMEYMKRKHFRASVEFVVSGNEANGISENQLIQLGGGRIRRVKYMPLQGEELLLSLMEYLHGRKGKGFFGVELNHTDLSEMLLKSGFYNSFPHYGFNSRTLKFHSLSGCGMLEYIGKSPCITINDTAALNLISGSSCQPEFFEDYKQLWQRYCVNTKVWKKLCCILKEYSLKNDIIASFAKNEKCTVQDYRYIIPFSCSENAEMIISFLKENNIIGEKSGINGFTSDSCEVIISDCFGNRHKFDRLFSQIYALMTPDTVTVCYDSYNGEAVVCSDNLYSGDILTDNDEIIELLEYFAEIGYIINLYCDGNVFSFTYATRQIKKLLTSEEKMAEVYTYHRLKETGYFDDIASGYEYRCTSGNKKGRVGCIVTKGFKTMLVQFGEDTSSACDFGENTTAVIISDEVNGNEIIMQSCDVTDDMGDIFMRSMSGNYTEKENCNV